MTDFANERLDRLDYQILRRLAGEGRASDVALGDAVGLSGNAVARRRKLLEEQGVIGGYTVRLDLDRMGFGVQVLVQMELRSQTDDALSDFESAIRACKSVSKCWFVSGDVDFLALVHVPSLKDYDETYRQQLSSLPNVARIRSAFVLHTVLDRSTAPNVLDE